jgi:hypothetical protein
LLLDDSPLKARLQPHNHVCLREYTAPLRGADLELLNWEKGVNAAGPSAAHLLSPNGEESADADADTTVEATSAPTLTEPGAGADAAETAVQPSSESKSSRKRKKKQAEKAAQLASSAPPQKTYDTTLLAIIGILDEVKNQGNVAGWIRAGGLWGPGSPTHREEGNDAETVEEEGTAEKRSGISADEDEEMPASQATTPPESSPPPSSLRDAEVPDSARNPETDGDGVKLWFEDVRAVEYWVERGKTACEELGVEINHGLEK